MNSTPPPDSPVILYAANSSLLRTIEVLGDGWTFLILRAAFFGVRRFEGFRQATRAPRARISERLEHLVLHDVLRKQPYSDRPLRHEYVLSERGHDLYGLIMLMKSWGEAWREAAPTLALVHKCGETFRPILICRACRDPISWEGVDTGDAINAERNPRFPVRRQLKQEVYEADPLGDPVAKTLAVIADQWTMLVLREIFGGRTTFDSLRTRLEIAKSTLASRLRHLVGHGVLERSLYQMKPKRYAYRLTNSGRDLFGIAITMNAWGEKWLRDASSARSSLTHRVCSEVLEPIIVCQACGMTVASRDVNRPEIAESPQNGAGLDGEL